MSLADRIINALRTLVLIEERTRGLEERVKAAAVKLENHEARLVRLETLVEIARPDGSVLRLKPPQG